MTDQKRRPGDLIIDRYLPNADEETRERAHVNLRRFARALLRIAIRETSEALKNSDSPKSSKGATMGEAPPPNL